MISHQHRHECDVAVIGAGYVGSVAALFLAQKGFRVALVEAKNFYDKSDCRDPRTFAIMASVAEWLVPLLCHAHHYFHPITSTRISCEGSTKTCSMENQAQPIAYTVTAQDLRKMISHAYDQDKYNGKIFRAAAKKWVVHDHGVDIHLSDGSVCTAQMIWGADGRDSFVRSAAGIHSTPSTFPQKALVFTTNSIPGVPYNCAYEHFFPHGNVAILPQASRESWGWVWIDTPARIERLSTLSPEDFSQACYTMARAFLTLPQSPALPLLHKKQKCLAYGLHGHIADTFFFPRGVLMGDAACTIHPVAAQGLNVGLHGVHHMVSTIASHARLGMSWWDWPTQVTYEKQHRPFAQRMSWAMKALVYGFSLQRIPSHRPKAWELFSTILSYDLMKKHIWRFI